MGSKEMAWTWSIFRRSDREESDDVIGNARKAAPHSTESWEARLLEEGVSTEWAGQLAERLDPALQDFSPAAADALIRGAVVAVEMQSDVYASIEKNMRDVKEVERLLGAFSGELEKLDEVLEVLSAYAQRMRNKPARTPRRTLH